MLALCLAALAGCRGDEASTGAVLDVTSPGVEGATVIIGGTARGETPCRVFNVPEGSIYVILAKDGYHRADKLVLVPESGVVEVEIPMDPIVGYVTFESEPPGASVMLNGGDEVGVTPLARCPVPVGDHKYELRLNDYELFEGTLSIEENRSYTKPHVLKPKPAWLQVQSRPSGARVRIDGEPYKDATPTRISLPPDVYTVGVFADGFIPAERTITLKPNVNEEAVFELEVGNVPEGMVLVPAGEFKFGSDTDAAEEKPQSIQYLDAYYIDKYEVSNAEFRKVFPTYTFDEGTENWPARGISWRQASDYAKKVGKRLPNEKEWEKAARGTDGRIWPWGNTFDIKLLNYKGDKVDNLPVPVGDNRLGASPYGCFNMSGNVYEWVQDWYEPYEGNKQINNANYGQRFRVLRGGSFMSGQFETRCTARHLDLDEAKRADYGFRCAQDVPEGSPLATTAPPPATTAP